MVKKRLQELVEGLWANVERLVNVRDQGVGQVSGRAILFWM